MAAAPAGTIVQGRVPLALVRLLGGVRPLEALALLGIVAAAAVARFAWLPTRGTWDADQGHDMLVLTQFVQRGVVPLVGPPTSIGTFHHGVLYYYLLAPAAWLGGGDPTIVVAEIALAGVLAVIATWWLARMLATAVTGSAAAGGVAGLAAALVLGVSATAVEESTFLWNPNLIALSSAVTLIAALRAWETRRARWWLAVAIGQAVTMHCHVLGAVMLIPLIGLFLADLARRPRGERRPMVRAGLAAAGLIAVSYIPLLIFELGHDFSETRGAVAFLAGGGSAGSSGLNPVSRFVFGLLRVLAWPLTGLVTDAPVPGFLAGVGVLIGVGWLLLRSRDRAVAWWIAAALLVPILVLALGVSGLSTVTALPTDHYHAFLDPLVIVVVGIGIAVLWARGPIGRVAAAVCLVALVGWNVAHWPPAVAADGGWPAAQAAAQRLEQDAGGARVIALAGLPPFKTTEAYDFPLARDGHAPVAFSPSAPVLGEAVVVLCDDLFVPDCGGPAESRLIASAPAVASLRLVDRFSPALRRTLSVYLAPAR